MDSWSRIKTSQQNQIVQLVQGRIIGKMKESGKLQKKEAIEGYNDGAAEADIQAFLAKELQGVQQILSTRPVQATAEEEGDDEVLDQEGFMDDMSRRNSATKPSTATAEEATAAEVDQTVEGQESLQ